MWKKCPISKYKWKYKGKSHLITHQKSVHMGQTFQCKECDYQATQKYNLVAHHKSVHIGQKFQCPECDYHFTQKSNASEICLHGPKISVSWMWKSVKFQGSSHSGRIARCEVRLILADHHFPFNKTTKSFYWIIYYLFY